MTHRKGIVLLLITAVIWSTGGALMKGINWTGPTIASVRAVFAAIVMLLYIKKPRFDMGLYGWGLAVMTAITIGIFCVCNKLTTPSNAILLQYTAPIHTAIFGYLLLKEPIIKRDMACFGLIMLGMVLFVADGLQGGHLAGDLLALSSGITFGLMSILSRKMREKDPTLLTTHGFFWGTVLCALIFLPFSEMPTQLSPQPVILVLLVGFFQLGLGYLLYSIAMPHVKPVESVIVPMIEPILSPVWVFLFFSVLPSTLSILGGVVVLSGLILREILNMRASKKQVMQIK